jgi:hypothetical protein
VHTEQVSAESRLPHARQVWIVRPASSSAAVSGNSSASFFLSRNSAARRAERGPEPRQPREQLHETLDLGT